MMEGREQDYRNANDAIHLDESVKEEMRRKLVRKQKIWKIFPRRRVISCAAVLVVMVLFFSGVLDGPLASLRLSIRAKALVDAEYPKIDGSDRDWYGTFRDENGQYSDELMAGLKSFALDTAAMALDSKEGKNLCYSPASLYVALAMAAETAGGETRQQILEALHYVYPEGVMSGDWATWREDEPRYPIHSLAEDMYRYLTMTYREEWTNTTKIANSLWLNQIYVPKSSLDSAAAQQLAEQYMTSVYYENFQKKSVPQAMNDWVIKNTKGLIGGPDSDMELEDDTAMVLMSTLYYYAEWSDEFDKSKNEILPFYKADGTTIQAEYMCRTYNPRAVLAKDGYTAASLGMKGNSTITFILPDEGLTPVDILGNEDMMAEILDIKEDVEWETAEVRYKIPKFSFQSDIDLTETIQALGITDAFASEAADFSGILGTDDEENKPVGSPLWLSKIKQQTSLGIDEKGCEAAVVTKIWGAGAAMPVDRIIEFTLDRPFIILIEDNGPLFIGVIQMPAEK